MIKDYFKLIKVKQNLPEKKDNFVIKANVTKLGQP
jgi:hypothetical protein